MDPHPVLPQPPNPSSGVPAATPRDSINGCWILDKTKDPWSMSGYLAVMNVAADAIAAHEKGEIEHDTFHTIELDRRSVRIVKRSRVNNDLTVELTLGQEAVEYLPPKNRPKRMLALSDSPQHLCIESSLLTSNGTAITKDVKRLSDDGCTMVQTFTVQNEQSGQTQTTTRIFVPYNDTPPHLVPKPPIPGQPEE